MPPQLSVEPPHPFVPQNQQNPWSGLDTALEAPGLSQRSAQRRGLLFSLPCSLPEGSMPSLICCTAPHVHELSPTLGLLQPGRLPEEPAGDVSLLLRSPFPPSVADVPFSLNLGSPVVSVFFFPSCNLLYYCSHPSYINKCVRYMHSELNHLYIFTYLA